MTAGACSHVTAHACRGQQLQALTARNRRPLRARRPSYARSGGRPARCRPCRGRGRCLSPIPCRSITPRHRVLCGLTSSTVALPSAMASLSNLEQTLAAVADMQFPHAGLRPGERGGSSWQAVAGTLPMTPAPRNRLDLPGTCWPAPRRFRKGPASHSCQEVPGSTSMKTRQSPSGKQESFVEFLIS